jgi:dTDP-4-amino-4,6-dideoxygalactose transaminase
MFPQIDNAVLPPRGVGAQSWNMFCVLLPYERMGTTRQTFRASLRERGMATGLSYEPSHLTGLGQSLGYRRGQFPNAERIGDETVTLPLHCGMDLADVERVCDAIREII